MHVSYTNRSFLSQIPNTGEAALLSSEVQRGPKRNSEFPEPGHWDRSCAHRLIFVRLQMYAVFLSLSITADLALSWNMQWGHEHFL